jgi:hypothetical protein
LGDGVCIFLLVIISPSYYVSLWNELVKVSNAAPVSWGQSSDGGGALVQRTQAHQRATLAGNELQPDLGFLLRTIAESWR